MKIKKKTVGEKINDLLVDENESSDESLTEATAAKIAEFDEDEYEQPDARISEFRKRNVKLLSEQSAKYSGKISSRKDFESEEDENEHENDFYEESDESNDELEANLQSSEEENENKLIKVKTKNISEDEESMKEEEEDDSDEESDIEEDEDDEHEENEPLISESNRQTEIQKGVCVQNQLRIWERLLEFRINSQKILNKANQLPAPTDFSQIANIDEAKTETCTNIANLLSKLCELKKVLMEQNSDVHENVKIAPKRQMPKDVLEEEENFASNLEEHFLEFRNYRNNVLLKWDDRTKLLTPGIGSKRKSAQEDYDVVKKIAHALTNNSQALIERSQIPHNQRSNENKSENVKPQPHIYDDSDFYHQQLRELIEYKSNSSANASEVTRQYVELQKLRQKMKKKVDTRASKGRKIRYVIHKKLVNFMAPEDNSTWTEESKNELYKSLFSA